LWCGGGGGGWGGGGGGGVGGGGGGGGGEQTFVLPEKVHRIVCKNTVIFVFYEV